MSGRYVSRVLESTLKPDLKFTAAVLASFADEDGGSIWPAVGYVAYLRGLKERQVQTHLEELRRMQILDVVREATQWRPTHYHMALKQLPERAPYKPVDRQRSLLGGESPPSDPPGVQSTAPQPGVQSSAPGVQPTAPDPSLDPSRTHTYDARARADRSGVQPATPLDLSPRLPILVAPTRTPDHDAHAWCGPRFCVPKFLHRECKKALGGPMKLRPARMRAFYLETTNAIPAAHSIGDPIKFVRSAFAARFRGALSATVNTRVIIATTEQVFDRERTTDQIARVLAEARAERERKSG